VTHQYKNTENYNLRVTIYSKAGILKPIAPFFFTFWQKTFSSKTVPTVETRHALSLPDNKKTEATLHIGFIVFRV